MAKLYPYCKSAFKYIVINAASCPNNETLLKFKQHFYCCIWCSSIPFCEEGFFCFPINLINSEVEKYSTENKLEYNLFMSWKLQTGTI